MTFPEVWTIPLFTRFCLFASGVQSVVVKTLLKIFSLCFPCWAYFLKKPFSRSFLLFFIFFSPGIGNLATIKIHSLCQLISWLKFSKFCEVLIAAPQFQVPTVAAMAGDKSVSFSLQIAVLLSAWSFADDYWFVWGFSVQIISPSPRGFVFYQNIFVNLSRFYEWHQN